jgi:hypothetical protein
MVSVVLTTRVQLQRGERVDDVELQARLEALTHEHRDLDVAIDALRTRVGHDQIQLARLKKRKLRLRDDIAHCQDMLIPDIIA